MNIIYRPWHRHMPLFACDTPHRTLYFPCTYCHQAKQRFIVCGAPQENKGTPHKRTTYWYRASCVTIESRSISACYFFNTFCLLHIFTGIIEHAHQIFPHRWETTQMSHLLQNLQDKLYSWKTYALSWRQTIQMWRLWEKFLHTLCSNQAQESKRYVSISDSSIKVGHTPSGRSAWKDWFLLFCITI